MRQSHEYKVIPAPRRGEKAKGAKSVGDRFAVALAHVMNDLAREGWEYLRAETLPCEERVGFTGTATHFHHMLVFRRPIAENAGLTAAAGVVPVARPSEVTRAESTGARAIETPPEPTVVALARPVAPEGMAPPLGPATIEDLRPGTKR